jgi:dipeptidyl aminopeptidase/acylaminoacyl peptidase
MPELPVSSAIPLIPRAVLFGPPERSLPRVSPDGKLLAYLAPRDGVVNVYARDLDGGNDRPLTAETTRPLRAYYWAESSRYVLYPQDSGGDENFHLFRTDVATGETADLTPFPGAKASLVALSPRHPDAALISLNRRDPRFFDVYYCDLTTGELTLVAENPGDVIGWEADDALEVRAATASRPDGGNDIRVRATPEGEWRTLVSSAFDERADVVSFTGDGAGVYVLTDAGVNTARLYLADVATGEMTLVYAREDADVSNALAHPTTRRIEAVACDRGRQAWAALTPEIEADLENLRRADRGDLTEVSRSRDDRTWVVTYVSDDGPVRYYRYDRPTGRTEFLFTSRPALEGLTLARMESFEIPARDGLSLPCYLSLPPGVEPVNLPTVLLVHGGPRARDVWGYNSYVQWLANRGYAVLQVNYRASTGFGKAHRNAGNREWAGKMHDDLLDAVTWVVERGVADPAKVAIMGGSYGGYATLVGLTFTPETFACGVDIVGPSNLLTLMDSIPPYWEPMKEVFRQMIGNPATEPDFLKARSPLFHAERIVRPLLIAQGANDPRVKQAESDQIVEAARKNGKDVEYLLYADEGHGFARPRNMLSFAAAAEAFLARHLGGRHEPAQPGEDPPLVPASVP